MCRWVSPGKATSSWTFIPPRGPWRCLGKDKVAVVCAHSALPLGVEPWRHTCASHRWSPEENKTVHDSDTHSSDAYAKFIVCGQQWNLLRWLSAVWHALRGKCSGRLVPATGGVSYLFRVYSLPSSLPQEGPPCFLALKVSRQGLSGCAEVKHTHTRTGCVCVCVCSVMAGSVVACQGQCNQPKMKLCSFHWTSEFAPLRAAVVHHRV